MTQNSSHFPRRIAILGAAGTGKTRLATGLIAAWSGLSDLPPIVIADDPPPPYAAPHSSQDGFDHVLLMGLDLPMANVSAPEWERGDRALREALGKAKRPYTVIYGEGPARLASALEALSTLLGSGETPAAAGNRKQWVWACDTCSDPDCERRLLSGLLAARAA